MKKKKPTKAQVKERKERKRLYNQKYYYKKKYKEATYTKKGTPRKKIDAVKQGRAKYRFEKALDDLDKLRSKKRQAEEQKAKRQAVKEEQKAKRQAVKIAPVEKGVQVEIFLGPFDYFHKKNFIDYLMFNESHTYYKNKADKKAGIESNYAPGYIVVTKKPRIKVTHYLGIDIRTDLDEALESITYTFRALWIDRPGDSPISMSIIYFQRGSQIVGYEIVN